MCCLIQIQFTIYQMEDTRFVSVELFDRYQTWVLPHSDLNAILSINSSGFMEKSNLVKRESVSGNKFGWAVSRPSDVANLTARKGGMNFLFSDCIPDSNGAIFCSSAGHNDPGVMWRPSQCFLNEFLKFYFLRGLSVYQRKKGQRSRD